ncbi:GNAT family N-acetyltransferase [Pelagibius marinus]|uniref:GNAT family N-acetyltransferase n=1 Tax=Pelagibius marinus TaxID=2762760 RepID=UPI0018731FA1|nr:GNAT family N-acetyltransferase [Pelagibius marinus]
MNDTDIRYRPATPADAEALAELINFAGEGLPLYLWERMAEPGESAWDVGRRRAQRETGAFSYRNAVVAERGGSVIAGLVAYRVADEPEPIDAETPGMFVPLIELENMVPGSWYVNVLAVFPQHRGQGLGGKLLEIAAEQARENASRGESIIVSDANTGARRLYERRGYRFVDQRPMVKDDWENPGENWVLLVK